MATRPGHRSDHGTAGGYPEARSERVLAQAIDLAISLFATPAGAERGLRRSAHERNCSTRA